MRKRLGLVRAGRGTLGFRKSTNKCTWGPHLRPNLEVLEDRRPPGAMILPFVFGGAALGVVEHFEIQVLEDYISSR